MFDFEWDSSKAARNLRKHRVDFDTAATVILDPLASTIPDEDHSEFEDRWLTTGETRDRRLLVVSHTMRQTGGRMSVRIISARPATRNERLDYERGR